MPTVWEVLQARSLNPSTRNDGFHLALVAEGGGMRGVVSGGMVSALEAHGLLPCFDSIHGSSAGACAGAYFASGQAELGTSIYYENINNNKFIDLRRFWLGRPIMNVHFLIDDVMQNAKRMRFDSFSGQAGFLHIVTTDAVTGEAVVFNSFSSREDFFRKLKASIYLPIIAGKHLEVDGRMLCDGGVSEQIAIRSALGAGATHILVLMTRRVDELIRPTRRAKHLNFEELMIASVYGRAFANKYRERNVRINKLIEQILSGRIVQDNNEVAVDHVIRPASSLLIDRLTKDGTLLKQAAVEAAEATNSYLSRGEKVFPY